MKISLIGYMGSGKSTIGKQLAQAYKLPFMDLDAYIEKSEKMTITEIFQTKGEIYFRKKENTYLTEILQKDKFILSTGGGTPVFFNNMEILNQHSLTIYLMANPGLLAARLYQEKEKRPLIRHLAQEDLREFIAKHLFERNPFYQQAQHTINIQGKTPLEITTEITLLIQNHQNHP